MNPDCRSSPPTGCVTYGRYTSGMFIRRNTVLRAVAFSLVTLNLPANSYQSGCGSWHDVTDPSYTSYSRGPVFTTTLPSNRNGWPLSYTGRSPGLSPTEPFTSKNRPV